jgi:hypothetical protein
VIGTEREDKKNLSRKGREGNEEWNNVQEFVPVNQEMRSEKMQSSYTANIRGIIRSQKESTSV